MQKNTELTSESIAPDITIQPITLSDYALATAVWDYLVDNLHGLRFEFIRDRFSYADESDVKLILDTFDRSGHVDYDPFRVSYIATKHWGGQPLNPMSDHQLFMTAEEAEYEALKAELASVTSRTDDESEARIASLETERDELKAEIESLKSELEAEREHRIRNEKLTADVISGLDAEISELRQHTNDDSSQGKPEPVVTTEPKRYSGLLIRNHHVNDAKTKAEASKSLYGYEQVELTAREWVGELQQGRTIQPSLFRRNAKGKFSHGKDEWQESYIVCADADRIKGIETLEDGSEKFPNGVEPWTERGKLKEMYPNLGDMCFAVTESVSSMSESKPPPHRRFRIIFVFDQPITSIEHYESILHHLHFQFPIIPDVDRSPAQPVFGNARKGYDGAWVPGNILKLSDFPLIQEPDESPAHQQGTTQRRKVGQYWGQKDHYGQVNDTQRKYKDNLTGLISDAGIATKGNPDSKGRQRVECVFNRDHTGTFVALDDNGYPTWHCDHDGCANYGFNDFAKQAGIFVEHSIATPANREAIREQKARIANLLLN